MSSPILTVFKTFVCVLIYSFANRLLIEDTGEEIFPMNWKKDCGAVRKLVSGVCLNVLMPPVELKGIKKDL